MTAKVRRREFIAKLSYGMTKQATLVVCTRA